MLNLNDIYYFVQVVDKKGFSAAGKALSMPKSSLSRRVMDLEAHLGARLIQRTSRRFLITDAGIEFYQHAQAMLAEAEAAEQSVKRRLTEPQGAVRITCSVAIAQFALADLLPRFISLFPKIDIVEHATNRYVDLVEEGFDLALRAHSQPLPDSSLIRRPIAPTPWGLFAGERYIAQHGMPTAPADLRHHNGILLKGQTSEGRWELRNNRDESIAIPFKPKLCSDDILTLKKAAGAGVGIVALPRYLCKTEVLQGTLVPVLSEWTAGNAMITLLVPSRRGLLPSVRTLTHFLAKELQAAITGQCDNIDGANILPPNPPPTILQVAP